MILTLTKPVRATDRNVMLSQSVEIFALVRRNGRARTTAGFSARSAAKLATCVLFSAKIHDIWLFPHTLHVSDRLFGLFIAVHVTLLQPTPPGSTTLAFWHLSAHQAPRASFIASLKNVDSGERLNPAGRAHRSIALGETFS